MWYEGLENLGLIGTNGVIKRGFVKSWVCRGAPRLLMAALALNGSGQCKTLEVAF
jgi:hypothetical protein